MVRQWIQSAGSVTLRSSTRPHPVTLCTKLDGNAADRDIIHQPLHLGLMACCRQTCVLCAYHKPTYSFLCQISAGSIVSRLTNGFSNPLVCWKFFQPSVLKPEPKMYLNTSILLDSCLSHPPAERERDEGRKGEGHQESSNNEMSSRADHNC